MCDRGTALTGVQLRYGGVVTVRISRRGIDREKRRYIEYLERNREQNGRAKRGGYEEGNEEGTPRGYKASGWIVLNRSSQ